MAGLTLIPTEVYEALLELWEAQKELGKSPLGYVPRYPAAVQALERLDKAGMLTTPESAPYYSGR